MTRFVQKAFPDSPYAATDPGEDTRKSSWQGRGQESLAASYKMDSTNEHMDYTKNKDLL